MFQVATGVTVTGYEVNRIWWEGSHSTPHYIEMGQYGCMLVNTDNNDHPDPEYVDELEGKTCLIPANTAIMFCYFNNLQYFHKYLQEYQGKVPVSIYSRYNEYLLLAGTCVILIGPIDGERHCEPEPKYLMDHKDWFLMNKMSIRGEDEIAVYTRREQKEL